MAKKTVQKPISFERQMNTLLRINENAKIDMEGDGYIQLKMDLKLSRMAKFISHFYKVRNYRKFLLTDFNCTLYRMIRQEPMKMRDLIQWFIDREKLSFFEARALVMEYIGNLMRRALIVAEVPAEENSEGPADNQ